MDDQRLTALEAQVDTLVESQRKIERALLGDMDGKPGMIHEHRELVCEIYGCKESKGIKSRMEELERNRWQERGFVAGISVAVSAAWHWLIGGSK